MRHRRRTVAVAAALVLAGCGGGPGPGTSDAAPVNGFPLTVENCDGQLTLPRPAQRAVLIGRYNSPLVEAIGAMDKVAARVGDFPVDVFPAWQNVPRIGGGEDQGGSLDITLETVLAASPDVVIGFEPEGSGISRESLAQSGIPFVNGFPADCPNAGPLYQVGSVDAVYDQVQLYGQIFDRKDAAAVASLRERVAKVQAAAAGGPPRTAAALFVGVAGGQLYGYGKRSIVNARMQAAGLTNVFGTIDDRDIEVSFENVLAMDPEVLIVLTLSDNASARNALLALPGASGLQAVRDTGSW